MARHGSFLNGYTALGIPLTDGRWINPSVEKGNLGASPFVQQSVFVPANVTRRTSYVFRIPFNIKRFAFKPELSDPTTGRLSRPWIAYRIGLFMNYTCKSLINQTNQDFTALLLCDGASLDTVREEIAKHYTLPDNIRVIDGNDDAEVTREIMQGSDFYCHTKLDSDNMYHRSYVEHLHRHIPRPDTRFLAFTKGYAFDAHTGSLALYRATREYFYARVGKVADWESDMRVPQPIGITEAAESVPHELIHDPAIFGITCHGRNVSNTSALVHPTRTIFDPETIGNVWQGFTGERTPHTLSDQ